MSRLRSARLALALFALLGAGCSSSDSAEVVAEDEQVVTSEAAVDPEPTAPPTTETIPVEAVAIPDIQIVAVAFGDAGYVEIANNGTEDAALDGIWLCQFPTYVDLGTVVPGGTVAAGASVQIAAGGIGGLDIAGGEAALYTTPNFESAESISGFVQWGTGGARAAVAAEAGLWPAGATVTPDPELNLIELFGDPADVESWG